MPIPASKIVSVTPRLLQAGAAELEMAGLLLTQNELVPFPAVLSFDSAAAVKSYFGAESQEYALAQTYFLGYDNSFRKPRVLYFAQRAASAIAGFLRGAAVEGKLSDYTSITSGTLSLEIDGAEVAVSDIDLSPATSLSAAAAIVTEYLAAVKPNVDVSWSSLTRAFTVTSAATGSASSVSYAQDSTLSALLGLRQSDGGLISLGSDALSGALSMDSVTTQTQNFVSFSTVYEAADDEAMSLAQWANNQGSEYLYVLWSADKQLLSQTDTSSIAKQLLDANMSAVAAVFGEAMYAAFIMGIGASIDWNRKGGAITFAFKRQDGMAATITQNNLDDILNNKRISFYGRYATRSDQFFCLYNGCMFGQWRFIDAYINNIWLRNVIQTSLMSGLTTSPRTPYTQGGYTLIRAWMMDPIERAVLNGVIEAGVSLSNSQKAEIAQEAGLDISMDIYAKGYYLQVLDPAAAVRVNRDSPVINLWYTYGGSIHKLNVPVSAIL